MRKKLDFIPKMHGWHFKNDISTDLKGALRTYGLCGGMCLSDFNYLGHKIKIPSLTSVDTTYDFIRNIRDNFSVKPPYIEPALVSKAGMINPLAETVVARAVRSRPR